MNSLLQKLFDEYDVIEKDRYEISQIFSLLPDYKKKLVLEKFWEIYSRLKKFERDLIEEQEILIWDSISRIKNAIEFVKLKQKIN